MTICLIRKQVVAPRYRPSAYSELHSVAALYHQAIHSTPLPIPRTVPSSGNPTIPIIRKYLHLKLQRPPSSTPLSMRLHNPFLLRTSSLQLCQPA
jgi:hypothetical protein